MTHEERYTSGSYAEQNPGWHADESPWKARAIAAMIEKNHLAPLTIAEVGCGVGEVLARLQTLLPPPVQLTGYDISPQAIELARVRENDRLRFELGDLPEETKPFDLLLIIDVLEHIEDHLRWLRNLHGRGAYTILHIPLDLTVHRVVRRRALVGIRRRYGHLHYFNRELAIEMLSDAGYEVLDWAYTEEFREGTPDSAVDGLLAAARRAMYGVNADWTVRLIGGCRLLVLAR